MGARRQVARPYFFFQMRTSTFKSHHLILALVTFALALALSACGGGSSSTGTDATHGGTPTGSEATGGESSAAAGSLSDYIRRASAICNATDATQRAIYAKYAKTHSKASQETNKGQEEIITNIGVPTTAKELDELRELPVPSEKAEAVEEMLSSAETALKKSEEDPSLFLKVETNPFLPSEKLSRALGLKACGFT
jgi:hypothetical protein